MSRAPTKTAKPPTTTQRKKRSGWRPSLLTAGAAVVVFVLLKIADEVSSQLVPKFVDHLPDFLNAIRNWPLVVQSVVVLGIGAAVFGISWLIFLALKAAKREEEEQAAETLVDQGALLHKHVEEPLQKIESAIKDLGQPQPPPAAPSKVVAPTGLPLAASLIGRENVLADLLENLRKGTTMGVFALEGMGGVGKSALAAEAVAHLSQEQAAFPGGAVWIACEGLEGEAGLADLWTRVATALQLERVKALADPQARRVALAQTLAQGKRLLLALDNLEPGLDVETALETLAVRGHTALLLTARHKVAPLKLRAIDLAPLPQPDAERLLVERLQQMDASRPTAAEAPAVPALLSALGGLPLALEVTAAYAGIQRRTLGQVVDEVKVDGLSAAALRADPKRAPLVRFERSWQVLTPSQQRLFAGLSLQAGASFPREAALVLGTASPDPADDLGTLVRYALVEALPGGERLRLHSLLREFAEHKLGRLTHTEREGLGEALVTWWLTYASAHPGYVGMDVLEAEIAELMGALAWAHAHAQYRKVLGLAQVLSRFLFVRGHREEARLVRPWALEAAQALNDPREEQWATHELALLDYLTGRLAEARAGYERALKLAQQLRDPKAERNEVHGLARLDAEQGRLAEARAGFERALELAQQLKDPRAEQRSFHELARLDSMQGRLAEARAKYVRALDLAQQLKDLTAERREVHGLARLDAEQGRLAEARAGFERALTLAQQLVDPAAEASELRNLGVLIGLHGEPEQGRKMISEALATSERLSDIVNIGKAHRYLARIDEQAGNREEAIAHYREALRCFEQLQAPEAEEVRAALRRLEG